MKVIVVSVGAPKTVRLAKAIRDYESRIARYFRFEAATVRQRRVRAGEDPALAAVKECDDLLARVPRGFEVVALDERGTAWSSERMAAYLNDLALHGAPGVAFLIGGPFGLSEPLRSEAKHVVSLSGFTLAHELAHLVLVEQIYRAGTIIRGEPYHKRG